MFSGGSASPIFLFSYGRNEIGYVNVDLQNDAKCFHWRFYPIAKEILPLFNNRQLVDDPQNCSDFQKFFANFCESAWNIQDFLERNEKYEIVEMLSH